MSSKTMTYILIYCACCWLVVSYISYMEPDTIFQKEIGDAQYYFTLIFFDFLLAPIWLPFAIVLFLWGRNHDSDDEAQS